MSTKSRFFVLIKFCRPANEPFSPFRGGRPQHEHATSVSQIRARYFYYRCPPVLAYTIIVIDGVLVAWLRIKRI